jgi:hypothetical protein
MEFSYRISEAEYAAAFKLRSRQASGSAVVKTVMFWVFILICLMVLWTVVQHSVPHPQPAEYRPSIPSSTNVSSTVLTNSLPFLAIAGVWLFLLTRLGPRSLRRLYRKDPNMQGEFTVEITPESISTRNTSGVSTTSGWNIYDYWREGKDLIVLIYQSSAFTVLNIAGLSDIQRDELRTILSLALPKK